MWPVPKLLVLWQCCWFYDTPVISLEIGAAGHFTFGMQIDIDEHYNPSMIGHSCLESSDVFKFWEITGNIWEMVQTWVQWKTKTIRSMTYWIAAVQFITVKFIHQLQVFLNHIFIRLYSSLPKFIQLVVACWHNNSCVGLVTDRSWVQFPNCSTFT